MAWVIQSLLENGSSCTGLNLAIQYPALVKGSPYTGLAETTDQTRRPVSFRPPSLGIHREGGRERRS